MLINLGGLNLHNGRLEEAKKNLNAALEKEPGQPIALLNLAAVAIKQRDFPRAHELLARATQVPFVEAQAYELMAVLEKAETGQVNPLRLRLATLSGFPSWEIEKRYILYLQETGATEAAVTQLKPCL
ncbi:MAG: tetratricopeptide repeat protein [Chthoniobacterales bacterium]